MIVEATPAVRGASLFGGLVAVSALLLLVLGTGCATPSEESDGDRRGAGDSGLRVIGQPSEEALAAREGRSHLRFRVQDYEHHLERQSPDGRITITSQPTGAQVFLVERAGIEVYQGDTPLEFFARANGMSHIFVLRKPGHLERRIDVAASYRNPDVRVRVVLEEDLSLQQPEELAHSPFDHIQDYWNIRERAIYSRDMPAGTRGRHSHTRFPEDDAGEDPR